MPAMLFESCGREKTGAQSRARRIRSYTCRKATRCLTAGPAVFSNLYLLLFGHILLLFVVGSATAFSLKATRVGNVLTC